jgi:hypothetical protein
MITQHRRGVCRGNCHFFWLEQRRTRATEGLRPEFERLNAACYAENTGQTVESRFDGAVSTLIWAASKEGGRVSRGRLSLKFDNPPLLTYDLFEASGVIRETGSGNLPLETARCLDPNVSMCGRAPERKISTELSAA